MKITTNTERITPELADEWLSEHFERIATLKYKQRKLYRSVASRYAHDMRNKLWLESPDPIIFDSNGDLADGQHRLLAIKESGVTLEMTVTRGWAPEVINAIDRGRNRTVCDSLALSGTKNPNVVASSVSSAVRVVYRGLSPGVSYAACLYLLDHVNLRPHIEKVTSGLEAHGLKAIGRTVGPLVFYRMIKPRKADEFIEQYASLTGARGSGAQLYAKYMRGGNRSHQDGAVIALCSCIRLWDSGNAAEFVKFNAQACEWLAEENSKLTSQIKQLCGETVNRNKTRRSVRKLTQQHDV